VPASNRHRIASGVSIVAVMIVSLLLFARTQHHSAFDDLDRLPGGWAGAIAVVLGSAIVHELLHAIGWMLFAKIAWRDIHVRPTWSVMGFAVQTYAPMSPAAQRIALALPALLMAIAPIVAATTIGNGLLLLCALFFLLECFADITLLFATR
jgi:hypothetical protein